MRRGFSTLGCPRLPLPDVRDLALRTGWTGLELLSSPDEPVHTGLDASQRRAARAALGEEVSVLAVNSYVHCGSTKAGDEQIVAELVAQAGLAADLGARAVRVFPGGEGMGADARMATRLRAAAEHLPEGVALWLETHDSHGTGEAVARVLELADDTRVRAIWDLAHPIAGGEPWRETLSVLRPHLAHVQLKDERSADDHFPVPLGEGHLPVADVVRGLDATGYAGWLSLEWERKWIPSADPLEDVLIKGRGWLREVRAG